VSVEMAFGLSGRSVHVSTIKKHQGGEHSSTPSPSPSHLQLNPSNRLSLLSARQTRQRDYLNSGCIRYSHTSTLGKTPQL